LVIVPKSTLYNWVSEFNKWIPEFNVFMLHGNKEERVRLILFSFLREKKKKKKKKKKKINKYNLFIPLVAYY